MTQLGKTARLRVIKAVPFGLYLDAHELGEVLLPKRYVPADTRVGDALNVFLYLDSDDIPIATTLTPKVQVGQCAHLRVAAVNQVGAFLDWGLPKELLVPFNEQRTRMQAGRWYTVYVFIDGQTGRIAATSRLSDHLSETADDEYVAGQAVNLLICARTDLGLKAVIDGSHLGMILANDVIGDIHVGAHLTGFVKNVRDDGRINLQLQRTGERGRGQLDDRILSFLKTQGGRSTITDRSSPEVIFKQFGVSKANYKKALGRLYKARRIDLNKDCVTLLDAPDDAKNI